MASTCRDRPPPIDKNRPSPQWIASLRERFPCETEVDRVLTRKLQRRAGPAYQPLSLDALTQDTEKLLRARQVGDFRIADARWLSGGASKLQMAFTLHWHAPGKGPSATPMVLRMEPSESIVESSRLREFQIIKAACEQASGLEVDAEAMSFYEVFNTYKAIAIVLATGYRVARNGKTHQDILVAWLSGVSYLLMNELRLQLDKVI